MVERGLLLSADYWGYCDGCKRWFYWGRIAPEEAVCPVCGIAPAKIEDRTEQGD